MYALDGKPSLKSTRALLFSLITRSCIPSTRASHFLIKFELFSKIFSITLLISALVDVSVDVEADLEELSTEIQTTRERLNAVLVSGNSQSCNSLSITLFSLEIV